MKALVGFEPGEGHIRGLLLNCETSNIAKVPNSATCHGHAMTLVMLQDGIKWHDIECRHKKPIICQESQELLDYALGDYDEYEDYYYDYE